MRMYMSEYIKTIEKKENFSEDEVEELVLKIKFFQHERLIHLIVTFFFALFAIIFLALGMISYVFLIPFVLLIIFVILYIFHYLVYLTKFYSQCVNVYKHYILLNLFLYRYAMPFFVFCCSLFFKFILSDIGFPS